MKVTVLTFKHIWHFVLKIHEGWEVRHTKLFSNLEILQKYNPNIDTLYLLIQLNKGTDKAKGKGKG
jgi:hypothetical protein